MVSVGVHRSYAFPACSLGKFQLELRRSTRHGTLTTLPTSSKILYNQQRFSRSLILLFDHYFCSRWTTIRQGRAIWIQWKPPGGTTQPTSTRPLTNWAKWWSNYITLAAQWKVEMKIRISIRTLLLHNRCLLILPALTLQWWSLRRSALLSDSTTLLSVQFSILAFVQNMQPYNTTSNWLIKFLGLRCVRAVMNSI